MTNAVITPTMTMLLDEEAFRRDLIDGAITGLTSTTKTLPPVWFYDEYGSQLFDQITRLEEYYPTRAERALLEAHGAEIAALTGARTFAELGAGTCDKSRILIDALIEHGTLRTYVPLDVSAETLRIAADELSVAYPGLAVHALVADFFRHLAVLPEQGPRLIAFLGGTIGNLNPKERARFYFDLDCAMSQGDWLLLGTDLRKDPARLVAAYDDAAGITATFNRNALRVLNAEFDGDFDPRRFEHRAVWNDEDSWIEMRLHSTVAQVVTLKSLDLEISFDKGEEIRTEISTKFATDALRDELEKGGFVVEAMWDQPGGDFLLTLARPYC